MPKLTPEVVEAELQRIADNPDSVNLHYVIALLCTAMVILLKRQIAQPRVGHGQEGME